jgi:hypothetical protein
MRNWKAKKTPNSKVFFILDDDFAFDNFTPFIDCHHHRLFGGVAKRMGQVSAHHTPALAGGARGEHGLRKRTEIFKRFSPCAKRLCALLSPLGDHGENARQAHTIIHSYFLKLCWDKKRPATSLYL